MSAILKQEIWCNTQSLKYISPSEQKCSFQEILVLFTKKLYRQSHLYSLFRVVCQHATTITNCHYLSGLDKYHFCNLFLLDQFPLILHARKLRWGINLMMTHNSLLLKGVDTYNWGTRHNHIVMEDNAQTKFHEIICKKNK